MTPSALRMASTPLEARPAVVRRKRDTENVAEFAIKIRYPTLGMIHGADDDVAQST